MYTGNLNYSSMVSVSKGFTELGEEVEGFTRYCVFLLVYLLRWPIVKTNGKRKYKGGNSPRDTCSLKIKSPAWSLDMQVTFKLQTQGE